MEGLGNTACSLECLACLNHVHGWTIWGGYGTLPLKPRFLRSIGSLASCSATGPFWILVTSGSLNSNSTRARKPAWFPSLCPVVMHSPVMTGLFRVPWIGFFFPPSVPASRATYDWAYPIGSPFSIAMYGVTDSALKRLASTVPVRQQVSGVLLRPTTRRYEIDLKPLIEHRKVMLSHEA